jgi:hypothetical protein
MSGACQPSSVGKEKQAESATVNSLEQEFEETTDYPFNETFTEGGK